MRRARPLQTRLIEIEAARLVRRARVDPHRLPGCVVDVVRDRDQGPGELGAEVEDLVAVGNVAGFAFGAVQETRGGVFLCGGSTVLARDGGRGSWRTLFLSRVASLSPAPVW